MHINHKKCFIYSKNDLFQYFECSYWWIEATYDAQKGTKRMLSFNIFVLTYFLDFFQIMISNRFFPYHTSSEISKFINFNFLVQKFNFLLRYFLNAYDQNYCFYSLELFILRLHAHFFDFSDKNQNSDFLQIKKDFTWKISIKKNLKYRYFKNIIDLINKLLLFYYNNCA